jgi:phosphate transport system substrate-binding protein
MRAERWVQVLLLWVVLVGISETNAPAQAAAPASVNGVSNTNAPAQELEGLRPYVAEQQVSGVIRNFGNNYIPALMKAWEEGFRRKQPGIRFETDLPGSEAAMASLYGGTADLAFIGREGYESETHAFEETFGYPPLGIEISSGSFATPHKTFALMVFVHKSNPLARLSLPELARLYGCPDTGNRSAITVWGQLGLKGEWEHRPIHLYGYTPTTGMARYFQRAVLNGSNRWAEQLRDFDNGRQPNGEVINAGVFVLDALAKDPDGIAYANFLYAGPEVRALALSKNESFHATYWEPTRPNAFRRDYPLTRFTTVFLNRRPGQPVDPKLCEFLRYILSRDGMNAVLQDGSYLPLNAAQVQLELKKLK